MKKEKKERYELKKCFVVLEARDKFELPLLVVNCLSEIASFLCVPVQTIKESVIHKRIIRNQFKVLRVNIKDNEYQNYGCADRKDYLHHLSEKYGVNELTINVLAKSFGPEEDFGRLVEMIKDISKEGV